MNAESPFYRRWILANGWAEAVGLGTTFALGRVLDPSLDRLTSTREVLLGALAAVLLGTLLEGVLVGMAQDAVLRQRLRSLRKGAWVRATAAGAGLAWLLGMVPSTLMALGQQQVAPAPPAEPGALVQYGLAAALGLVTGPILGLAQWTVLRRHVARAGRWLGANAAAWAAGMPVVFFGMDKVPWAGPPAATFLAIYVVCGAAGLVVGAIHGRVLVSLIKSEVGPPREARRAQRAAAGAL